MGLNDTQETAIRQITARILSMRGSAHSDAAIIAALKMEGWHPLAVDEAHRRVRGDQMDAKAADLVNAYREGRLIESTQKAGQQK